MNVLEHLIETVLPYIISVLEIMGILVVAWSAIHAFWEYIQNSFMKKNLDIQFHLANGLLRDLNSKWLPRS